MTQERSGSGDVERTLQLLWNPDGASGRGPRRSMTVGSIVDHAVTIADEHGLESVSIRSVAKSLGVGAMTLYRYVPSKAELLDLMLDRVNRPALEPLPEGWRQGTAAVARELWRLHTTHRWLSQVDQARPVLGPNAVNALDRALGALQGIALTDQEKVAVIVTIESFVVALARTANAVVTAEERTSVTHDEFWRSQESALVVAMESGRYPHMATLAEDAFGASLEVVFEFGLERILDGVQSLLDSRGAEPAAKPAG